MSATELTAAVRQGLADLTAPLREQLNQLDAAILAMSNDLDELRKTRMQVKRTLGLLDPESVPAKKASSNGGSGKGVSLQMRERIRAWLTAHNHELGDGFTASSLSREPDLGISQAQLSAGLPMLQEEGFVRLDRRGTGGSKIYKLVGRG